MLGARYVLNTVEVRSLSSAALTRDRVASTSTKRRRTSRSLPPAATACLTARRPWLYGASSDQWSFTRKLFPSERPSSVPLSTLFAVHLAHQKNCRCTGLVFHSGAPRGFAKNSSNCAMVVYNPSASLGLQNRDRKPRVHDSTAPAFSLLEAAVHIANTLKLLNNQRWLSFCRASISKSGLLQHVMSELTLFLVCSRFAVFLTAHASPAHS